MFLLRVLLFGCDDYVPCRDFAVIAIFFAVVNFNRTNRTMFCRLLGGLLSSVHDNFLPWELPLLLLKKSQECARKQTNNRELR